MLNARITGILFFASLAACADTAPDEGAPREGGIPPVDSAPAAERADSAIITLFFSRGEEPTAVTRSVSDTAVGPETALRLLLQGPTPDERHEGVNSWFSAATADQLDSLRVAAPGELVVFFGSLDTVIPNASSSAGSALLLRELNSTIFQFSQVRSVEYRMRGSCDAFWNWLQFGCQVVTRADVVGSSTTAQ